MTVTIYADGACTNNGYPNASGGWGIWFNGGVCEACGRLPGSPQTSNRAELYAVYKALEYGYRRDSSIKIRTDSEYCVNIFNKWIQNWQYHGWVDSDGSPVKNQDLIFKIRDKMQPGSVTFEHVQGHKGDWGNERANELAQLGAKGHTIG